MSPANVHTGVETLYKQSFGSLLNILMRRYPDLEIEAAEDILQETFSAAITHWERDAIPDNPGTNYAVVLF